MSLPPHQPSPAPPAAPRIELPVELPVAAHRDAIIASIRAHQVVIVCGETGSGKTTQLPKLAWLARQDTAKNNATRRPRRIGMTEPRRIAARSVAQRLAQETQTPLGQFIGWKVRFTDEAGPATRIKVMTDGILLAETQSDPQLSAYDTIILDEAQNTTGEQMLMFLTRLGYNTRAVVTGDPTQVDLPPQKQSGLIEAMRLLKDIEGLALVTLNHKDIVRHPLVQRIIRAYETDRHGSK